MAGFEGIIEMTSAFYPGGREVAATFLKALDPDPARVWHGMLLDERQGIRAKIKGTVDELLDRIGQQTRPINVFIRPNPGGVEAKAITSAHAVWLDLDDKDFDSPDDAQKALRLAHQGGNTPTDGWPLGSVVVQSGRGWHCYWRLADATDPARFKPAQKALAKHFGGDAAVCDPGRLMRLPGTLNIKGEPVAVTMPVCQPERRYALDDLLERLGVDSEIEGAASPTLPPTAPVGDDWAAGRPDTPESRSEFESAINSLDPDLPRAEWLDVLCACRAHGWPDSYLRGVVEGWSAKGAKYDADEFSKDWASLRPQRPDGKSITPNTLYFMARQAGWQQEPDCPDPTTHDGLACRFAQWLDNRAMFSSGRWHVWAVAHWQPDTNADDGGDDDGEDVQAMPKLIKRFAYEYHKQAVQQHGPAALLATDSAQGKRARAVIAAAKKLLNQPEQDQVLRATAVMLSVPAGRLDAQHDMLATPNGTVDLRTGELLPSDPKHFMTMCAGCEFVPDAAAPRFEQFIREVFPDPALREYVQRWAGYCMTGHVNEEVMGAWHGTGANGKSVLSNLIDAMMGTYAVSGDPALLVSKSTALGQASPDIARLAGKRLCYINESNAGDRLNSGTIKRLVSTEKLTARPMYKDPFDFRPTAKILLRTNHRPVVNDAGDGLWRRLHLVPFSEVFKGAARDDHLETKLRAELTGILAWAVRGAVQWYRQGLTPPQAVQVATAAYRADSDIMAEWLALRVEAGRFTLTKALLADYALYAGLTHPPTVPAFAGMLKDHGLEAKHTKDGNGFKVTLRQATADEFGHVTAAVPPTRLATPPGAVDVFAGTEHAGKTVDEVCAELC